MAELKADYDNLKAQSQSQIQDLSKSLDQVNLQISTAKVTIVDKVPRLGYDGKDAEGRTLVVAEAEWELVGGYAATLMMGGSKDSCWNW